MKNFTSPQKDVKNFAEIHYGLDVLAISPIQKGVRNESFIIQTTDKKFVLRVYSSSRTFENISFELEIMGNLKKNDFPVPHVMHNLKGKPLTLVSIGGAEKIIILMDFMDGKALCENDLFLVESLAILQARMHKSLCENVKPRKEIIEVLQDWERWSNKERELMKPLLKQYGLEETYLRSLDEVKSRSNILFPSLLDVPFAECHNDFYGDNILVNKNKISAILDFDNLSASPLIFDIANTIFSWLFHLYPKIDPSIVEKYIKGYQTERKLSKNELELLFPLIASRNFAITNSLYTHGFAGGPERIEKTLKFDKDFSKYLRNSHI